MMKKRQIFSSKVFYLSPLFLLLVLFVVSSIGVLFESQKQDNAIVVEAEQQEKEYSEKITKVVDYIEDNHRVVVEHHDEARIPFLTVYRYPITDGVEAAVPPPFTFSGTNYYRVTSTDTSEDSGDKVCAIATGTACTGYVDESITGFNVCKAFNPTAAEVTGGSGTESVAYCDGPPQGGVCNGLTNTCLACPGCGPTSCNTIISGLYREMYVTCASAAPGGAIDLCTVEVDNEILDGENTYAGDDLLIDGCTFTIDGDHTGGNAFASLTIENGGVLTHNINTSDPPVIEITGNVIIDGSSSINLEGRGYRGGSANGNPSVDGEGPGGALGVNNNNNPTTAGGGGYAGAGSSSFGGVANGGGGVANGTHLPPFDFGSGGGRANALFTAGNGGGGGGRIDLTITGSLTVNGSISANGESGQQNGGDRIGGAGAGGGIDITASSFLGAGTISANGGIGLDDATRFSGNGGGGRIYLETTSGTISGSLTIEATSGSGNGNIGGAGTVMTKLSSQTNGTLTIDNNNLVVETAIFQDSTPFSGTFDILQIQNDATPSATGMVTSTSVTVDDANFLSKTASIHSLGSIIVQNAGSLSVRTSDTITPYTFNTTATSVSVDGTSSISANGGGYRGGGADGNASNDGEGSGGGSAANHNNNPTTAGGGAYGGAGATSTGGQVNSSGGAAYGTHLPPFESGSGGGKANSLGTSANGGAGGGILRFIVSGNFTNDGTVTSNGESGVSAGVGRIGGSGSGGAIQIEAANLLGSGVFRANGGIGLDDGTRFGGNGGGGRISVEATSGTIAGTLTYEAASGSGNGNKAGPGTIFTKEFAQTNGSLIVDNNGLVIEAALLEDSTPFSGTFDTIAIQDEGVATATAALTSTTVTIDNGNFLSQTASQHSFTTTSILNGGILQAHTADTASPYTVDISGTSLLIDATSFLDVSGDGYRGGGSNGNPSNNGEGSGGGLEATHNNNPTAAGGGAYGGAGSTATGAQVNSGGGSAYGTHLPPFDFGSGGGLANPFSGSADGGAGGGKVILTLSSSLTVDGVLAADGASGQNVCIGNCPKIGGAGSGGSIHVVAASILGSGTVRANGGVGLDDAVVFAGNGGGGRVFLDATSGTVSGSLTLEARSGINGGLIGGPGTVVTRDSTQTNGDLIISNEGNTIQSSLLEDSTPFSGTFDTISILSEGVATATDGLTATTLTIDNGTLLSQTANQHSITTVQVSNTGLFSIYPADTATPYELDLSSTTITIDPGSFISGDGGGFRGGDANGNPSINGEGPGGAPGQGNNNNPTTAGGGGYAGTGSNGTGGTANGVGGPAAGQFLLAFVAGSGGGKANALFTNADGGAGGGKITLTLSGVLTVDGTLSSTGASGENISGRIGGAGSGGSINVSAASVSGTGTISTNGGIGGDDGSRFAGSGGGGRMLITTTSGSIDSNLTFEAFGGSSAGTNPAAAGSVVLNEFGASDPDLIVNNNNQITAEFTPLIISGGPSSYTFFDVSVINRADLVIDTPCTGTVLTVNGTTDTSGNGTITNNQGGSCFASFAALSITPGLPDGSVNIAYSEQVQSPGGYAPKTFECLDGLGGSVVACNVASGWPAGLTMSATGAVTGTPTAGGNFSPIIRVTDSDPGGAVVAEQTLSLFINSAPNSPTLVSPADASQVGTTTPTLSAQYSDGDVGDTGTTDYRISSGSAGDCLSNTNIVDSGTSATTSTNNEATTYVVGTALTHSATYNWCARNNDGAVFSDSGNFTTMGSFTVNLGNAPNDPVLIAPGNTDTTNLLSPLLEATYSDPDGGDVGTTEFRVSSGSSADCLSNVNVVFSGASALTATNNETASVTVGIALTNLTTYNWCARNNDGIFTSNSGNFTTMGSFLVDTSFSPGGGVGTILQNQQQNNEGGGGDGDSDDEEILPPAEIDSFDISLSFSDINNSQFGRDLSPETVLFGLVTITNTNQATATDVFLNVPLPGFMDYVPGSLQIDGKSQTDTADEDAGQGSTNAISAIWASLGPNVSKTITFQLLSRSTARASAVELIQMQASLSASNANQTFVSTITEFDLQIEEDTPPDPADDTDEDAIEENEDPIDGEEGAPDEDSEDSVDGGDEDPGSESENLDDTNDQPDSEESISESAPPAEPVIPESSPGSTPTSPPDSTPESDLSPGSGFSTPPGPSNPVIPLLNQGGSDESNEDDGGDAIDDLFITGSVQSQNEQIEFAGTVNEPNAEVQVIVNGESFTIVSDENGVWQAFVSAEQLGIEQNTSQQVSIEVYAVNIETGEESNRIAQQIFVERFTDELIVEPVAVTISSNALITVFDQVQGQVQELIEEREEEIQTTLVITAPVVVVSSVSLWGYLPYLPTMVFHFISWLVGLFGRKKQEDERFYGIVYDSITKEPIPLAIVRVYKLIDSEPGVHVNQSRQLVTTVVTDKLGRYEALLQSGEYKIDVRKPQFTFPSAVVQSDSDGEYTNIYNGILSGEFISTPDIPLDPENAPKKWQTGNLLKKTWILLQKVGRFLAVPTLFIGALVGVLTLNNDPSNIVNWMLSLLYVLLLVMQITFRLNPQKAWGLVYDLATNAPLPLTTLQLIDPEFGKVVKSRLSDYEGRFSFLPEPGKYVIKATKQGYLQTDVVESDKGHNPISGEITLEKKDQHITGDIAMRQE